MWLIDIIATMIDKIYIVAGEIHSQTNIRMVRRIVIHQWYKKPGDINQSQQREQKKICAV